MENIYYPHSIRDSIHGTIRLSDEESRILDNPIFFRLHHVRQNGLLYLVFPSASHTRFEHSLGVLHIVDSIFHSLLRNSHRAEKKGGISTSDSSHEMGKACPFHETSPRMLQDLLRLVRFAALVHDLGHGPFSHTFDSFAPFAKDIAFIIKADPKLQSLNGLAESLTNKKKVDARVEHEEMSCVFFALIWQKLVEQNNCEDGNNFTKADVPQLVASIILGDNNLAANDKIKPYIPLLHDLVASAPIDADRMDYMERDSRSIGVSYGLYDRERLLKSLLVYRDKLHEEDGLNFDHFRLGIKKSGLRAVENFIQARFELFVQIYYHKTNRAVQLMLEEIAKLATSERVDVFKADNSDKLVETYTSLSDVRFLRVLQNEDNNFRFDNSEAINKMADLARKIANRRLWKRVFEDTHTETKSVCDQLQSNFADIKFDRISPKATKDLQSGEALLHRDQKGLYVKIPGKSWSDYSKMIKALAEEEDTIARIYYTGDDNELLKNIRQQARVIASSPNQNVTMS